MEERVCRICGHNTFVGEQLVCETVVLYGDGSFIEVVEQQEVDGPRGPFRCRGCGAVADTLAQLTARSEGDR